MADFFSIFIDWPQSYNTLIVLLSALIMSAACAIIGGFAVLNKQALISDVAAHATVPGVAIGFLLGILFNIDNNAIAIATILLSAGISAAIGVYSVNWITSHSRLRPDAAMGTILSSFYGFGLVLFSIIQRLDGVNAAGLDRFLLGQITGITMAESLVITTLSCTALIGAIITKRQLTWLCFDSTYLQAHNPQLKKWTGRILLVLILLAICAGLRTVGIVLFVALMIIPAASIRIWSHNIASFLTGSALFGILGCYIGIQISANYVNIPAGASIVLSCTTLFIASIITAQIIRRII